MKHILRVREHAGEVTMAEANRIANEIAAKLGIDPGSVEIEETEYYDDDDEESVTGICLVGRREATEAEVASPPRGLELVVIYGEGEGWSEKGWGDYLAQALKDQAGIWRMPFVPSPAEQAKLDRIKAREDELARARARSFADATPIDWVDAPRIGKGET